MAKVVAGWLAAVALSACVFGACGGDDDASPGPTTAAVSPEATPPAPTPGPSSEATGVATFTAEQAALADGLPTAEELGPGWKEQSRGPATPTTNVFCDQPVEFTNSDVLAGYSNVEAGHAFLVVGIARRTGDSLELVREALVDCKELTSEAPGQPAATYTVESVDFDMLGDDTVAIKVTTQFGGSPQPSEGYFVLVQDGDLVLAVADIYLVTANLEETKAIVGAAYDSLQRVAN